MEIALIYFVSVAGVVALVISLAVINRGIKRSDAVLEARRELAKTMIKSKLR